MFKITFLFYEFLPYKSIEDITDKISYMFDVAVSIDYLNKSVSIYGDKNSIKELISFLNSKKPPYYEIERIFELNVIEVR